MTRALLFRPGQPPLPGGMELIQQWQSSSEARIWLMLADGDLEEQKQLLQQTFAIHPLAIVDALRDRHPPKVERFSNSTFLLLKGLDAKTDSVANLGTVQLSLFIGERYLVTRSSGPSVSSNRLFDSLAKGGDTGDTEPSALALRLCRTAVDRFLPLLFQIEDRLDEMEAELLHRPSDRLLADLVRQKGDLKRLLRVLQYHSQAFATLKQDLPDQLAGKIHEVTDVHEQLDRQLSLGWMYYELTGDLMDGYLSLSAHRLNRIMQTLTIVTVVFVPITFMAGLYGMNFEFIPELSYRYGYFVLLALMLIVATSILWIFRRKGWLGRNDNQSRRESGF